MVTRAATRPRHRPAARRTAPLAPPTWGFLTNYAVVLVYVALHPESTVRTIAQAIGITERATLAIMRDLDDEGIVDRRREGRRNTYTVNFSRLAKMRRGGTVSTLTPRLFIDVVVKTLFDIAKERGGVHLPPPAAGDVTTERRAGVWGFFTNHLLILLAIARDGTQTVRELAGGIEITERASVAILNQLEADDVIVRHREGRRNSYTIDLDAFRKHRSWTFEDWRIPPQLIDVAAGGIRMLSESTNNGAKH